MHTAHTRERLQFHLLYLVLEYSSINNTVEGLVTVPGCDLALVWWFGSLSVRIHIVTTEALRARRGSVDGGERNTIARRGGRQLSMVMATSPNASVSLLLDATFELHSCSLSLRVFYERCGCDNVCVVFIGFALPIFMAILWVTYRLYTFVTSAWWPNSIQYEVLTDPPNAHPCDAIERAAWAAVQRLPSVVWGDLLGCECSLCMDAFERGQVVRQLPCGHRYHLRCIDRWLLHGQAGAPRRRCPLCSRDPLSDDTVLLTKDRPARHRSDGALRVVVGSNARRSSSPALVSHGLSDDAVENGPPAPRPRLSGPRPHERCDESK